MTPQVGDIWDWDKQGDGDEGPILLLEYTHSDHDFGEETKHFIALDLLTGTYDDFIFNNTNMLYWKKIA